MELVAESKTMFEELPSGIRKKFGNDPGTFLEFVENPANKAELQDMGVIMGNDGLDRDGKPSGAPVKDPEPTPEEPVV